ncbi:YihY/virulence factor BrkB family protein [Blautia sp.]|uniref:YihY/virulence factor BrkB family protein n=1 Tax=Blautia sp. TaxID=1955243 RepID=UPI00280BE509|nr:YihY/virulence factor BrkB family protein [Blautia sp.]MDY3016355.1 YihY/virulence factor BrkB family protein [Blautia sp.]MED9881483.1 YihY/virulence factor BrkB family protein [Blautia sp.]
MGKKKEKGAFHLALGFMERMRMDHISAYAAQTAYFLIMSFIPFVLFLTAIVQYTPLTYREVRQAIVGVVPENLQGFVLNIVAEVFSKSAAVLPISALMALWSSGKGMQALINGLNTIYHVRETRNWLINRIYSMFYMLLFVLALIASLLLLVMGSRIHMLISDYIPFLGNIIGRILNAKTFLVFVMQFLVFLVLYRYLPNRKASLKSQVPGAFFTAAAWSAFSYLFSLYFTFFPDFSIMYGSLSTLILVMVWLYFCMNLLLYGAEVNAYFEKQFRQAKMSFGQLISRKEQEWKQNFQKRKEEKKEKINEKS